MIAKYGDRTPRRTIIFLRDVRGSAAYPSLILRLLRFVQQYGGNDPHIR